LDVVLGNLPLKFVGNEYGMMGVMVVLELVLTAEF
jgi:hypothetical protein